MDTKHLGLMVGVLAASVIGASARAEPLRAPQNINAEPSTPRSAKLNSEAAKAEIAGDPQDSLKLATRGIVADPKDPWGYYDKATALARIGKTDEAVSAFSDAEQRFAPSDTWGRSVAIYGRAHALAQANRCEEARQDFSRYADLVRAKDAKSAELAVRYAADCK
jgi:Flp pilus assembly protein TadD